MGIILHNVVEAAINFPSKNARILIEDNAGDHFPIHVHFGQDHQDRGDWKVRIHFTYDEFRRVIEAMKEVGKL